MCQYFDQRQIVYINRINFTNLKRYKLLHSRVNLEELHTEGKQGPASADGHFLYLGGSDAEGTVFIIFY